MRREQIPVRLIEKRFGAFLNEPRAHVEVLPLSTEFRAVKFSVGARFLTIKVPRADLCSNLVSFSRKYIGQVVDMFRATDTSAVPAAPGNEPTRFVGQEVNCNA